MSGPARHPEALPGDPPAKRPQGPREAGLSRLLFALRGLFEIAQVLFAQIALGDAVIELSQRFSVLHNFPIPHWAGFHKHLSDIAVIPGTFEVIRPHAYQN